MRMISSPKKYADITGGGNTACYIKELFYMKTLKKELNTVRALIPYNTYRTILGQIKAGDEEAARVGIERIKRKGLKCSGHTGN